MLSSRLLLPSRSAASLRRYYFTNVDRVKGDDPYAVLGLQWGDGATTKEIQTVFRQKAAKLHPDVNTTDSPSVALKKFQKLRDAYEILTKIHSNLSGVDAAKDDEWRFSVWRNGDRIAVERSDVAGVAKQRPIQPAGNAERYNGMTLGHPNGGGYRRSGEFIGDGSDKKTRTSSSVGRGHNKWVKAKEFKPWNGRCGTKASVLLKRNTNDQY